MVRKLLARAKTLDTYKKFVMALGDSKLNRLDALIRAGLKRGVGIHGMLDLLDRANKGLYSPKNFTEEEMLRGLLFLRLGGARVADLAHRSLGHPGESTLRRSTAVTTISPCAGMPTQTEIRANIQAIFHGTNLPNNYGYVLMIDEIKLEERPRWDDRTNKISGLCREHTGHLDLNFCSIDVAKGILRDILNREIHWASEVRTHCYLRSFKLTRTLLLPGKRLFLWHLIWRAASIWLTAFCNLWNLQEGTGRSTCRIDQECYHRLQGGGSDDRPTSILCCL